MDFNNPPAGRLIGMTSNLMHRVMSQTLSDEAYGPAETACITFICDRLKEEQKRPIFQRDIEKEFNLRSSSASETIKNLEKKGLLTRENIEGDGRKKKLIPTQAGLDYDAKIKSKFSKLDDILIKNITPEDFIIYQKVAKQIIENLKMEEING